MTVTLITDCHSARSNLRISNPDFSVLERIASRNASRTRAKLFKQGGTEMRVRTKSILLLMAAVFLILVGGMQAQSAGADKAPTPGAKAATSGDYVGTETCIGCHEDQQKRFKNTVMGKVFARPRTADEKLGCE